MPVVKTNRKIEGKHMHSHRNSIPSVAVALVCMLGSGSSYADGPFTKSRLFVNQSMRHDVGRTFGVGVNFTIAPVKAAAKKAIQDYKSAYPAESEAVLQAAQYVPASELEALRNDPEGVRQRLTAVSTLSDTERQQINAAFAQYGTNATYVADLLLIMQEPETAITFSLEPFAEFHLGVMDIVLTVPLAGFVEDSTEFAMGNIGVDLKFGESWGESFAVGVSGGLQVWAPTATERANALGLANLQWSPRYFHEYMTVVPYLVLGGDLKFVQLQASLSYNLMEQVKGNPDFDRVHFLQWGASFAITAIPYIVVSAELSGLVNMVNAAAYDSLVLTTGLRAVVSFMDLGLGFQVPLIQQDGSSFASLNSVSFGAPSSYNVIFSATFGF